MTKTKVHIKRLAAFTSHYSSVSYGYDGFCYVNPYVPVAPPPRPLAAWGALGWNRTHPLHPIYNMGVSIAELKDFPHMISQTWRGMQSIAASAHKLTRGWGSMRDFARDIGKGPKYLADHYLNGQFGWVPFYQDLMAVVNYQEKLAKKLAWLRRHNGKAVRRKVQLYKGGFSEAISRSATMQSMCGPVLQTFLYSGSVTQTYNCDVTKTYDCRIWYVAKYLFYVPELEPKHAAQLLSGLKRRLYGLSADPSIIYKVIPWSWMLDWFVNVGVVLQNMYLNASSLVVAKYAYVMGKEDYSYDAPGWVTVHTGDRKLNPVSGVYEWSGGDRTFSGTSQTRFEIRQRMEASPYGFGSTFTGFSSFQWSILVALGLGKGYKPR